jgi:hypothetical protein
MPEIREYNDLRDPDLTRSWAVLESAGACPNPFASHLWVRHWSDQFAADATPRVFVGLESDEPRGLAPLLQGTDGAVEFPVNFLSPRCEFLLSGDAPGAFVSTVLDALRADGHELLLRGVPSSSRTRAAILECARDSGYLVGETEGRSSPYVDVDGTWEDYTATRTTKRVARWRKRVRKIEKIEAMRVCRFDDSTDVDELVDAFIGVEAGSWKEQQGTSIGGRGLEEFYHGVCRAMAEAGWFTPVWLEREGNMFAFLLSIVYGDAVYAMKTSFDEKYKEFSPGTPLFFYTVTDAFEKGYVKVDFLGEPSRWKSEWATGHLDHVNMQLRPAGITGAVKHLRDARVKPIAKKILRRE